MGGAYKEVDSLQGGEGGALEKVKGGTVEYVGGVGRVGGTKVLGAATMIGGRHIKRYKSRYSRGSGRRSI